MAKIDCGTGDCYFTVSMRVWIQICIDPSLNLDSFTCNLVSCGPRPSSLRKTLEVLSKHYIYICMCLCKHGVLSVLNSLDGPGQRVLDREFTMIIKCQQLCLKPVGYVGWKGRRQSDEQLVMTFELSEWVRLVERYAWTVGSLSSAVADLWMRQMVYGRMHLESIIGWSSRTCR